MAGPVIDADDDIYVVANNDLERFRKITDNGATATVDWTAPVNGNGVNPVYGPYATSIDPSGTKVYQYSDFVQPAEQRSVA